MKKILAAVILICFLVGAVSCFHGNETDIVLDDIEELVFVNADSSAMLLDNVVERRLRPAQLYRYYLLRSRSDMLNNKRTLSDTVLMDAIDYYSERNKSVEQAWGYLGLAHINYLGDNEELALKCVQDANDLVADVSGEYRLKYYIQRYWGELLESTDPFSDSESHMSAALDFATKLKDTGLLSENILSTKVGNENVLHVQAIMQLDQARIDYDSGDYRSAYDHLLSYTHYMDTIYQRDSQKKLVDLQQRYNYTKRERERDHERLMRQKMTIISLVAVILLSLGSIVLYLHMSRKNRILTEKMTHAHNELDNKTSQLEYKSQMLDRFKTRIIESDRVVGRIDAMRNMTAAQLIRSSDNLLLTDTDIENLVRLINECDNGLIDRLRILSARLSHHDVALCCLLRLNVDKRNIAALLGVSDAALRKRKYRLHTDKLGAIMPDTESLEDLLEALARRTD